MLCPELWNFEPPASKTQCKFVKNDTDIRNIASNQYFNHFVSLTVPDTINVHPVIKDALSEDSEFYHVKALYAFELVKSEFINLFVKNGELTLLSIGTNIDEDDCVAITPTRKLIFSLCRKTYQELGIVGKPSSFSNKFVHKYVVTIDLTENSFVPGKKRYDRIMERLSSKKDLCFNVVLFWEPHETEICPSSIASYISSLNYEVKVCNVTLKQRCSYNVSVPVFNDESDGEIMVEWLGAFNLQCSIPEKADGFFTTYETPDQHVNFGQVAYLEAVGLFTTKRLKKLIQEVQNYVNETSPLSWIALHVQGFENSIVNRGSQEHFFYSCGDYHYTVFFRSQGPSLLCTFTSSTRRPKTSTKKNK